MKTEILSIDTIQKFQSAVARAAELLLAGELVAIPTETVYGLAAVATNPSAVAKIYTAKGRPSHNPLIVHVADRNMARSTTTAWNEMADILADRFWPGPLTLVLPRSSMIPDIITAGGSTVAIRWPEHPFALEVIRRVGAPIAAPSANLSNQISPTHADHVVRGLGGKIPLIVDAGQAQVGIESTVIDISSDVPRVLRPGMITEEQILRTLGIKSLGDHSPLSQLHVDQTLRSPGMLEKHYAPRAKIMVWQWESETDLKQKLFTLPVPPTAIHLICHDKIPQNLALGRISVIPHDAEAYARALYGEWHTSDELGARLILVEELPHTAEWEGIRDRIKRASS
ncbi:MAG: L-threonylcarbamoyladenylate synthase [Verrucomicrobiales bacterium]